MEYNWLVSAESFQDRFPQNKPNHFFCLIPEPQNCQVAVKAIYLPQRQGDNKVVNICLKDVPVNTYLHKNWTAQTIKTILLVNQEKYAETFHE